MGRASCLEYAFTSKPGCHAACGVVYSFSAPPKSPSQTSRTTTLDDLRARVRLRRDRYQVPDESRLSDYCWVDLTADGEDILELAENLGGLEGGHNGGQPPRVHLKVRVSAIYCSVVDDGLRDPVSRCRRWCRRSSFFYASADG